MDYRIAMGTKSYSLCESKNIIFIIYLFFVIYLPPILKDGMIDRVILVVSACYVLININLMIKILGVKENRRMSCLTAILFAYSLLISMINSVINSSNSNSNFYGKPLDTFVFSIYFFTIAGTIAIYCIKNKVDTEGFLKMLVFVGLIQAVLVFASFFSSSIRTEFLNLISQNASDNRIADSVYYGHYTALRRNYGFADTLYDRFGYTCSILCAISFNFGLYKKKWLYYSASLIFVFCTLVNARSGVVLCVLAMITSMLIFFVHNNKVNKLIKLFGFIVLAVFIFICSLGVLQQYSPETYKWVNEGLGFFWGASSQVSNETGMGFYLTSDFWILPDFFGFIFGTARDPYRQIGQSTDNGYIKQIWYIGIIGLIISMKLFIGTIIRARKKCPSNMEKSIICTMLVLILVYMVKLLAFKNIGGTYIILGYCFLLNSIHAIPNIKKQGQ